MIKLKRTDLSTRKAFGIRMMEYGEINKDFVVFDADIGSSTSSALFGKKFPERYFDMGIAELAMVSAAAGMASSGRNVIVSSYGIFLTTRALEAIRTFICYPILNVKFMGTHGGLTAAIDGVTHQATEDVANISTLPNIKMAIPCDNNSARKIFDLSINTPGPFYIRLLRDNYYDLYDENAEFHLGGAHIIKEGKDITIGTYGDTIFQAIEAAKRLEKKGINTEIIDFYCIKPFDYETLTKSIAKTKKLLIIENHQQRNGIGYEVANYLINNKIYIPYRNIGIKDTFAESGKYSDIINKYAIDSDAIINSISKLL